MGCCFARRPAIEITTGSDRPSGAPAHTPEAILQSLPAFVVAADKDLCFAAIKGSTQEHLGLGREAVEKLIGEPLKSYFTGSEGHRIVAHFERALEGERVSFELEWHGNYYACHVAPLIDNDSAGAVCVGLDISSRRQLESELDSERQALAEAQRLAGLGSWVYDIRRDELVISPELARLLGIEHRKEPIAFAHVEPLFHPDETTMLTREKERLFREGGSYDIDHRIVRPDGSIRFVKSRGHVDRDDSGRSFRCVGTMMDVTARVEAQQAAEVLAYHDSLTGLPNRSLLSDRLRQAIARSERDLTRFLVLFIDLDNFKRINDSLGHAEGDVLLTEIGQRLRNAIRNTDTVARAGGDEFVVLISNSNENEEQTALRKVQNVFAVPFRLRGTEYFVRASIGVAAYPDDAKTERELLQCADSAMYEAKQAGRNALRRYRGTGNTALERRMQLEIDLPKAMRERQLRLHYQLLVDAKTLKISGVEALLRWEHPVRGLLTPTSFMDVMEGSEFIAPIGEWTLREAATQIVDWRRRFNLPLRLNVNVSARQLGRSDHLANRIAQTLEASGLEPEALELEITETAIVQDLERVIALLAEIRDLGVGIAIDDFGTGYNSLSYLKHFPVTALKIDRSFVAELGVDAFDEAISYAVAALGKALNIRVVAEGVETEQQAASLLELGCDELQGYYFAPPLSAAETEARLEGVLS